MLRRKDRSLAERFPPPAEPWSGDYMSRRERFWTAVLDDPEILERFASRAELPVGYGLGLDERCIEFAWLLAQGPRGAVLDAGSTLNNPPILDRFLPRAETLHILTLAYEGYAFPDRGISYVYGDLRRLPYRDGFFDTVASLSTLEHVGMDNTRYAEGATASADPQRDRLAAARELRRTVAPGGRLLVTVPYGMGEDGGWFEQLDRETLPELVAALGDDATVEIFRYDTGGWRRSSIDEAADARYGSPLPAAEAVACISVAVP
jgi:SAM-dependent methyltransferase